MIFSFTVGFENGTEITDNFVGIDEFNLWIVTAIADFGNVTFIKLNKVN